MNRAIELDPLNATWHGILAAHLTAAGRPEEALAAATRANEIEPNYYVSLLMLGSTLLAVGRQAEGLDALRESHRLAPWFGISAGYLATALRQAGHDEEADRVLASMGPTPRPLWGLVRYELMVGSLDAAADLFERMIEERDPFALVYAISEETSRLRAAPRWPALAAAMNLPSAPPAS
jgi:tetratricopeptide (TPR) repeat protein